MHTRSSALIALILLALLVSSGPATAQLHLGSGPRAAQRAGILGTAFTDTGSLRDGGSPVGCEGDSQLELRHRRINGAQHGGAISAENVTVADGLSAIVYAGLAVGVPGEYLGGAVAVVYGSPGGLSTADSQWFDQDTPGVPDTAEAWDGFGDVLAAGDLDGDGYPDLAVGNRKEDIGTTEDAGSVTILYGSPDGLSTAGSQWFDQDTEGVPDSVEAFDYFGCALAVGDLDGNGYADLAVGVCWEDVGTIQNAGGVTVLYGSPSGLSTAGSQWFDQDTEGVPDTCESGDKFGDTLAVGDLDRDGYADLVVGAPYETLGAAAGAGGIAVLYGSPRGLSTTDSQWFDQNILGVPDNAEEANHFGNALAVGDLNGDGYADLAVGVPGEDIGDIPAAGGVTVLYGSPTGLSTAGSQWFDQDTPGVPDTAESSDNFGDTLAVGDLDGDDYADLAVSAREYFGDSPNGAGAVTILYGSADGLSTAGSQWFDQDTPGVPDTSEDLDYFGKSLVAEDLNKDGYADLAVGAPSEDLGINYDAGGVTVLYGSPDGLSAAGSQWFDQDTEGVPGSVDDGNLFGYALAVLPAPVHSTYIPLTVRNYAQLTNGGFEDGWAGWTHGGELAQAIISDDGWSGPHSGTYAARLGSPSYECEWGVPIGSAWIQRTFSVPSTGASYLRIHYRIFSEDTYGTGQYDRFEILVNGVEMLSDGNMGDWGCDSPARSEGWESWDLDLTGYRGTNITLRLENITFDTYANTWTYVDDIQFVP